MKKTFASLFLCLSLISNTSAQEVSKVFTLEEIETLGTQLDASVTLPSVAIPGLSHFRIGKPIEGSASFLVGMAGEVTFLLQSYFAYNSFTQNGASGNNIPYASTSVNITTTHEYNYIAIGAMAVGAVAWAAAVVFDITDSAAELNRRKARILLDHQELVPRSF